MKVRVPLVIIATRNPVASDRQEQMASYSGRPVLWTRSSLKAQAPFQCCYWQHDWEEARWLVQLDLHRSIKVQQDIKCILFSTRFPFCPTWSTCHLEIWLLIIPPFEGTLKLLGETQAKSWVLIVADECDAALSEIIICGRHNNALLCPHV